MSSPTSRSLEYLREKEPNGIVQVTEKWNAFARIRQDLFHFVDVLQVTEDGNTNAYQVTSGSNVSARRKKIENDNAGALCLLKRAGWQVFIHGWSKKPKVPGSKQLIWTLREVQL